MDIIANPMTESTPLPLLRKWSLCFPWMFRCFAAKNPRIGMMTKYVTRPKIPRKEIKRLAYSMVSF